MDAIEYTKSLKYLPEEFKDFHDQKDLMKALHDLYKDNETLKNMPNTWVDNHVFIVDFFLYFMSLHGYKLQKIRNKKVKFYDLNKTVDEFKEKRIKELSNILSNGGK